MGNTPEYRAWTAMLQRCNNEKCHIFDYYGARGVTVCDRWRDSFENFFADMGLRPSANHSIDRIDNNGIYEPGNCRWATKAQQQRNTRYTKLTIDAVYEIRNSADPVAVLAERYGVGKRYIYQIRAGEKWA